MRFLPLVAVGLVACGVSHLDGVQCADARCGGGGRDDVGPGGTTDPGQGGTDDEGAGGTTGGGGTAGAGGNGGEDGGGGFDGTLCGPDVGSILGELLGHVAGLGFGHAPELEKGPIRAFVSAVQPGRVEVIGEGKETLILTWPEEIHHGFRTGERVEASRTQGWDLLLGETMSVGVYVEDAFVGPPSIAGAPGGPPPLGFALSCHFDDVIGSECGRAPVEKNALLDLTSGEVRISPRQSGSVEGWEVWNLLAMQQDGYTAGECVAEPWFVTAIAAVRE